MDCVYKSESVPLTDVDCVYKRESVPLTDVDRVYKRESVPLADVDWELAVRRAREQARRQEIAQLTAPERRLEVGI